MLGEGFVERGLVGVGQFAIRPPAVSTLHDKLFNSGLDFSQFLRHELGKFFKDLSFAHVVNLARLGFSGKPGFPTLWRSWGKTIFDWKNFLASGGAWFYSGATVAINHTRKPMDIIFNCSSCNQELEVDVTGAGSEITCPNCNETIVIPHVGTKGTRTSGADSSGKIPVSTSPPAGHSANPVSAMASSAAAKVEMHLKVPVASTPTASLIAKARPPLEVAAKDTDKKLRVKTIRHTDHIEVGHDKFDEYVTEFLGKIGESNIQSINPLTYTHLDIGSQKLMTEYAVMVVYHG